MADGDKKVNKLIMWIGIAVVVIVVEVGLSYYAVNKLLSPPRARSTAVTVVDSSGNVIQEPVEEEPSSEKPFQLLGRYTLADFVINPAQSNGEHFFVATIVFGFNKKELEATMIEREPILQDRIISMLSLRTFDWFGKQENKAVLKEDLRMLALDILNIKSGVQVFFTKFVLQ